MPAPPEPLTADSDAPVTIVVSIGKASGGSSSDGDENNSLGVTIIPHQARAADAEHGGTLVLASDVLLLSGFANAQVNQPTAKLEMLFKQTPLDQPELVWVRVGHLKRSAWLWLEDAVVVLIAKQRAHHDVSATLVRNLLTAIDCYEAEAELAEADALEAEEVAHALDVAGDQPSHKSRVPMIAQRFGWCGVDDRPRTPHGRARAITESAIGLRVPCGGSPEPSSAECRSG